ncbi:MAG: sodium-independent anion transporter [Kordiimonadales bacterium]|nr:MAG: sodium-independent anion transporter [Kordiimonadales bacterium]
MENLKGNLYGGITAAVVALPLALAFGVASGAGAAAGLYGAIFTGLFAALFGGTKTQVTGPTGPMSVVMATVITSFIALSPENGLALAFTVVMLGGLFQIAMGLLKIGKYIILVPYPVISGFMSGIGFLIIIIQIAPFLGHPITGNSVETIAALPQLLGTLNTTALIIAAVTLALTFFWPKSLSTYLPAPLAALIGGTVLMLMVFPDSNIIRIGEIPSTLPSLQLPIWDLSLTKDLITSALLLALLGAIDSLMTSLVADNMTGTKHNSDRELIGQGIGNMISGAFGALPGAGATMRTAINIKAGGTSQASGAIHAIILLIIALGAGGLVENIPEAVLAGILIKVGVDIIDWDYIKRLFRLPLFSQALMLGVMLATVFVDLMIAVGVGVFIANLVTIDRLTSLQLDGLFLTDGTNKSSKLTAAANKALAGFEEKVLLLNLAGPMSFGVAHDLKSRVREFTAYKTLIIDFSDAAIVGITSALVIEDIIRIEVEKGTPVFLTGLDDHIRKSFARLEIFALVPETHILPGYEDAISASQG